MTAGQICELTERRELSFTTCSPICDNSQRTFGPKGHVRGQTPDVAARAMACRRLAELCRNGRGRQAHGRGLTPDAAAAD